MKQNRATDLPLELNQFDMREQNSAAKVLLRNIFFSLQIVGADEGALLRERVAEASSLVCTGLVSFIGLSV